LTIDPPAIKDDILVSDQQYSLALKGIALEHSLILNPLGDKIDSAMTLHMLSNTDLPLI